ncbi:MAG: GntR family transcriptional regulator [Candidatus Saccharibacteria bacterium]|nr:GntR family transcriptional regulator [Candidatus Saccharibacteria bacterium]
MQFDNNIPIYLQIADLIRRQIVSGELSSGSKIPSVRELAVSLKVNPNTIARALAELEDEKLIFTERTNGKFVTNDNKIIVRIQQRLAVTTTETYLQNMQALGLSQEQIIECINNSKGGKPMRQRANFKMRGGKK